MAKLDLKADSIDELTKDDVIDTVAGTTDDGQDAEAVSDKKEAGTDKKETAPKKRSKIDEMSPEDAMRIHAQRNTYSVEVASKAAKEEIYAVDDDVFVEDGDERNEEDLYAIQRKKDYLELVASANENRILRGTIVSITVVDTNRDESDPSYIPEYMAKILFGYGTFIVKIPSYLLYYYFYPNMNRAMAENIRSNMENRLGAEIDFVVRHVDEEAGIAIADRLAVLSMRGVKYYTIQNGKAPRIRPGMRVQSKISAMTKDFIIVDAAGAEIRIHRSEVSWLFISDLFDFDGIRTQEKYRVGETVDVKILSVATKKVKVVNSAYTLVVAEGSIKQAKPNPRLKYFDEFHIGDIYSGYVTGVTEKGVYVNIENKMDCLCKFPRSGRSIPVVGDTVNVQVFAKDEEKKFVFANIR